MNVVLIGVVIVVAGLVLWLVLQTSQEQKKSALLEGQLKRAAPGFADDCDGAGAEHGADGHDWSKCFAAAGERDEGAAGWRFELRADRDARTNGDRQ